jgi:hypothetical protein
MAELSDLGRRRVWVDLMRKASRSGDAIDITKDELRDVVDALDTWFDANAGAANAAIPQPARGSLTATQKALVLMYVIQRRYVAGA